MVKGKEKVNLQKDQNQNKGNPVNNQLSEWNKSKKSICNDYSYQKENNEVKIWELFTDFQLI
jgi:hypothetical protein